jgi:serine/threonine-protein kinase
MAPELLSGGAASVKSDVYALGLVLFEVFTGRRAQEGATLDDLRTFHRTGTVTTPSSIVRDLDAAVERVILRCLDRNPERRPASALAVAAALPGGDPLAAALAAGETPSPEVLSAAGESAVLGVARGLTLAGVALVGLLVFTAASDRTALSRLSPLDDPPAVLVSRAQQIVAAAGYAGDPADAASGFMSFDDYRGWLRGRPLGPRRWDALATGNPSSVLFWHRSSPQELVPIEDAAVTLEDPPSTVTDMREVVLDPAGRLMRFRSVPPQVDEDIGDVPPPWGALFDAAGLAISGFVDATPQWTPPDFADARVAWSGSHPVLTDVTLRVEAASYRGRPVFFEVVGPWTEPERMEAGRDSSLDPGGHLLDGVRGARAVSATAVAGCAAGVVASSGRTRQGPSCRS